MQPRCRATGDQGVPARIDAAANGDGLDGSDHVLFNRNTDQIGCLSDTDTERAGDVLADRLLGGLAQRRSLGLGEIGFSAAIYQFYADNAEAFLADEPITLMGGEGSAIVRKSPLGVLLGIMPWNFPYYQVARFAGPNLIIGNPVLLKHAPQCPESAAAIEQIYLDAGFPVGAYTNIYATNDQVADIIANPIVQGVSLTGSERAGAAVAEIAGRHLKKVVLELGGSDPFILLSTDDLDATVAMATIARVDNCGQACNAAKRFIVMDHLYDEFVEKFTASVLATKVGNPTDDDINIGPLAQNHHIVFPGIAREIDTAVLAPVARADRGDLDWPAGAARNQRGIRFQQPNHAATHSTKAGQRDAQRFAHVVPRNFLSRALGELMGPRNRECGPVPRSP